MGGDECNEDAIKDVMQLMQVVKKLTCAVTRAEAVTEDVQMKSSAWKLNMNQLKTAVDNWKETTTCGGGAGVHTKQSLHYHSCCVLT